MSLQKNALFCDGELFFVDRGLLTQIMQLNRIRV
jgi:hypothetical protein